MRLYLSALLLLCHHALHAQWTYLWSGYTTSPNIEQANSSAVAGDGHVALVGSFQQDVQIGSFTGTGAPGNGLRGFVAMYAMDGTFQWAHALSGWHPSGADTEARDVAFDAQNNVIVAGTFNDSLLLDGVNVLSKPDTIVANAHVFYVLKFAPNGTLTWASAIGVEGYTGQLNAVAVDGNGDVYTVGEGGFDYGRFHKLSGVDGHVVFSLSPNGAGSFIQDVTTGPGNTVFIQGQATNTFTMGGLNCPYNAALGGGSTPLYVGKFNSTGQAQWYYVPDQTGSGYFGFPEGNIAVNAQGQCFVETRKMVRILDDTIADGNGAIHGLFALDATGQPLWARKLNRVGGQVYIADAHCDVYGDVLLAGKTYGNTLDLLDTVINSSSAGFNVFLGRYNATDGTLTGLLNGPSLQDVMAVGTDDENTVYLSGTAAGPVELGSTLISGSWNAFVTRLGLTVGIAEHAGAQHMAVWPVPTSGAFTLRLPTAANWDITVLDLQGRTVVRTRSNAATLSLDASSWAHGTYIVHAMRGGEQQQQLVVVQ